MVVDEDMVADKRIRRYLAYDLVLDNNRNLCKLPFSVGPPSSLLFSQTHGGSNDGLGVQRTSAKPLRVGAWQTSARVMSAVSLPKPC